MILRTLEQIAGDEGETPDRRILDVGCGNGLFFEKHAHFGDVSGIEPDEQLVDPEGPHAGQIQVGFFDSSCQAEKPLDWILMLDVLEHMEQPAEALRHARQMLRPGGKLVVTVPAFMLLWTQHDEWNQHRTRYRRRPLVELVEEQGFQVEMSRYFFHWPFFAKLLVRGVEWLIPGTPGPARVPPGFVNVACRFFTTADEWMYSWAQLPFGTSILLVASRPADPGETEA